MSLRNSLRQAVTNSQEKCCTVAVPRVCNNATSPIKTATAHATSNATTTPKASNIETIDTIRHATTVQQALKKHATTMQHHSKDKAIELKNLVRLCGEFYEFTEDEHVEALELAMNDFDSAMICFRSIACEIQRSSASD